MTRNASLSRPNSTRSARGSNRSTWLKLSIVSGSILATLAGTQGIAWLERGERNDVADAPSATAAIVAAAPTATSTAMIDSAEPTSAAQGISIFGLLPTITPAAAGGTSALAGKAVIPTEPPSPTSTFTPAPTVTPTLAPTMTPVQAQINLPVRPLTRSRSSR